MSDNQVNVNVTASTNQFNTAIQGVTDKFKSMVGGISSGTNGIAGGLNLAKTAVAGFVGAFAVNKIKDWGEEIGKAAEQIQRVAQITGMSADAVQEFNFAVEMSGGNAESAAATLQRLEKNMVDAKDATSDSSLAFKAMGIEVKDSEGKMRSTEKVLADVAEYFKGTADGAAKTALAMQLMGRGGAQLIPVLNQGADGLKEMNKALDATNSKMSPQQLEKFSQLDDKIDMLGKSWQGFKLAVSEFFEPAYSSIVEGFTSLIQMVTDWIKYVNDTIPVVKALEIAFRGLGGAIAGAGHLLQGVGATLRGDFTEAGKQAALALKAPAETAKDIVKSSPTGTKPEAATPQSGKQLADAKALSEELLKLKKTQSEQFLGLDAIRNQEALNLGKKTNSEFLSEELRLAEKKAAIDAEFYAKRQQVAKGDALALAKIENERLRVDIENSESIAQIRAKMAEQSMMQYQQMFDFVVDASQSMTEKLIRGTISFKEAFRQMCAGMIIEFAKMQVTNVAKAMWAAAMGKGISLSSAIAERGANAVKAASATYAAVSSIPYIGWIMAPIAAAGAFAGVMAFNVPSAEGGWAEVPNDGMAMIHKKEMVLPAPLAEKVRNMTDGGGGGGSSMVFNISALDGNSVKQMFMKHGSDLVAAINDQSRNLNPNAVLK